MKVRVQRFSRHHEPLANGISPGVDVLLSQVPDNEGTQPPI